jgi:hypothetical protein
MPYDPTLLRNVDRLRLRLGDVDADSEWLPDETYEALLTDAEGVVADAIPEAARALYAVIAMEPVKRTANGEVIDYSGRLPMLKAIFDAADNAAESPAVTRPRYDLLPSASVNTDARF